MWIGSVEITWKKIALVIGVILGVLLIIWFIWWLLQPQQGVPPPAQPPLIGGPGLPERRPGGPRQPLPPGVPPEPEEPGQPSQPSQIADGGLTTVDHLTSDPVTQFTLAGDGKTPVVYNPKEGLFYRITPDGTVTPLSSRIFRDVENVAWAKGATKGILEFPDGANILYNFATDTQVTLPREWQNFSFSPEGGSIAFKSLGRRDEDRWLAIANPDGSGAERIEHLGFKDNKVNVAWSPNNQVVATFPESQTGNDQEVYFIGRHQENFLSLPIEGRGFRSQWSPDGSHLLYSTYPIGGGSRPQLSIASAEGDAIGDTNIDLGLETWPEKCVFQNTTVLICAVPTELPDGAGLFPKVADAIPDQFVRVDLQTGTKTILATPASNTTADHLVLSDDGKYLFFTNKRTGILERMQLRP
ncbi:hypothetical protein HY624_01195 [Candidatus Uhrbacteria bacterium]|nr:hypothetical protein [Candidatus Uhrbacteria bacterium]